MSAVKLVVEVGALAVPGAGEAFEGGMSELSHAEGEHYLQIYIGVKLQ